ncbi:myb-like protein X isoform X2 [Macadamia integrifolia]|uniref:myb-like protein X isoform X2 n=1 Tax=Macadamia integrifolia TaxID=60698 RepID=UPI001C4EB554|nr:myb-like protein X isoform X2 [Macadamia integrifolia]
MNEVAGSGYKLNKKVKLEFAKAKASKNGFKSEGRRKKPSETEIEGPSMNYKMDESVLLKEKNGGRKSSGTGVKDRRRHLGQERYKEKIDEKQQLGQASSDRKRKRIYADQDARQEGVLRNNEVPNRKSMHREGEYLQKNDFSSKGKRNTEGTFSGGVSSAMRQKSYNDKVVDGRRESRAVRLPKDGDSLDMKHYSGSTENRKRRTGVSDGRRESKAGRFSKDRGSLDVKHYSGSTENRKRSTGVSDGRRESRAGRLSKDGDCLDMKHYSGSTENRKGSSGVSDGKLKMKGKAEGRQVSTNLDEGENGSQKMHAKGKYDSTMHVNQRQNRRQALDKTTKKIMRDKKDLDDESVETERPFKKKKRVIRIDPHDISNKRLDDGISVNESIVKKKSDPEEKTELSKNAQFRAIQPSPSILSFVEDNLLGRRRLIELRRSGYNIELSAPLDNVPFSTSSERERIEESVFRNKLTYFAAAKVSSSFPPAELPEIAFAGRSNVGKSSLLNALTRQWGVVRTSDKPGLTQTINFFELGKKLCLVDLPGYGFAYAKEEVKDAWEELVKEYVSTRVGLKRVCLLIDTKWGMKPRDHELINLMERTSRQISPLFNQ